MDEYDQEFSTGDSCAAGKDPKQCSALRKNGHIIIKNRPCKIVEMSSSKTGKHGSAKIHLVAIDIFTSRKYEEIYSSTQTVWTPIVTRKDYELINIMDGFLILMADCSLIEDISLPDTEVGREIEEKFRNKAESESLMVSFII